MQCNVYNAMQLILYIYKKNKKGLPFFVELINLKNNKILLEFLSVLNVEFLFYFYFLSCFHFHWV